MSHYAFEKLVWKIDSQCQWVNSTHEVLITLYLESIQDGQAITLRTSGPIQFVSFSETNKKLKKFTVIDDKSDDYDAHQNNSQLQCSLQMNISYFSL